MESCVEKKALQYSAIMFSYKLFCIIKYRFFKIDKIKLDLELDGAMKSELDKNSCNPNTCQQPQVCLALSVCDLWLGIYKENDLESYCTNKKSVNF